MAKESSSARNPLILLAFIEITVVFFGVLLAAYADCEISSECLETPGNLVLEAILVGMIVLICEFAVGLYQQQQRMSFREVVARLAVGMVSAAIVSMAFLSFFPPPGIPMIVLVVGIAGSAALISIIRYSFMRIVDQNVFRRKTLIFGSGDRIAYIDTLRRKADRRGFKIVGVVASNDESGMQVKSVDGASAEGSLLDIALRLDAEEIVIAMDDRRGKLPIKELLECRLHGIEVIYLVEFLERETGRVHIDLVNPGWLIFSKGFRKNQLRMTTKRVMDLILSVIVLVLSLPVMLAVYIAIKIEDGWRSPVIYRQERVGQNGVPFSLKKFRSMVTSAESKGGPVWASKNDARITKVGHFIRNTRLDELPQLVNVMLGQMSIVGPRPERPGFVEELSKSIPYYAERHTVRPGLTGWAQLNYPYGASHQDAIQKLHYDLYYAKNHTLLLDIVIVLQTVEVVLWAKGAR